MKTTVKAALLLFVFGVCALGAIFSPKPEPQERDQPAQVVPVKNSQRPRGIWLRV
jgi:hypothetical protein